MLGPLSYHGHRQARRRTRARRALGRIADATSLMSPGTHTFLSLPLLSFLNGRMVDTRPSRLFFYHYRAPGCLVTRGGLVGHERMPEICHDDDLRTADIFKKRARQG